MEVVGGLASSLQIVSQCGQVTMTVIRWVESVRTVDERIDAFIHEVSTLRMTYEGLDRSLKDPFILEAARLTNRDVGGHLWTQISKTLHDCEATMNNIAGILGKIQSSSNFLRPVLKQLKESLYTGELVRLREQVVMFNSSLQLPMQMFTLTMQLRQQEMTAAHQVHLNEQLALLGKGIECILRGLSEPRRSHTMSSATMVGDASSQTWVDNMQKYVGTAKKFHDSASVAASTLSARSTSRYDAESPIDNGLRRGSTFIPLTQQKVKAINTYVEDVVPMGSGGVSGTPLPSDTPSDLEVPQNPVFESEDEDDDDIDLQLLKVLLQNGNTEVANQNYPVAEENFKEALSVSQIHNFGSQIACSAIDIALMLGECLAKQEKYDETIELLQPLAGPSSAHVDGPESAALSTISSSHLETDKGQMLAASHLLGKVYLMKADYTNAEKCSVQAFKGRKRLLGDNHAKTIESVHLVIDMYKAKGQNARAEAHRVFLKPALPSPLAAEPMPIAPTSSPTRPRRPTFNFTSPFKRGDKTDKTEDALIPIPTKRGSNAHRSSFLVADEFNYLSTSPNDTSSLHMGLETRPIDRQVRTHSTKSNGSSPNIQRWTTTSDVDPNQIGHHRAPTSLSKQPTVYAVLSPSDLEKRFVEISALQKEGKGGKAIDRGITILQQYDPDSIMLVHRKAELKENIRRSKDKGLAGTGHGFSPLHFFCSMKYEPLMEIDILLRQGADPGAVAYKAGYGKVDPFVPLILAIDRGHENIVKMLLEYGATWQPEVLRTGSVFNADKDIMHPLLQACQKGRTNIVRIMLEHHIELTEDLFPRTSWHGNSLLHEACYRCDLDTVSLLLNFARHNGTLYDSNYSFIGNPSQQDEFGMTAVMYAVDMREYNEKLRVYKLQNRVACLRLLLGLNNSDEIQHPNPSRESLDNRSQQNSPSKLAAGLHLQDKRGNTVYWYTDKSKAEDSGVITFLDEQSQKSRLIDL